jgi:two-component system, NtrC family, sensor histidine kinase HydH
MLDLELAALLEDLRDVGRLERERRIQFERVAALQTLSAGLAHEVRNPVNSAKLQLEVLGRRLRREYDDPRLLEPIELVQQEIERLTRLLNEFLAFARPPDLHLGQHDVVAIAQDIVDSERALVDQRGAAIALAGGAPVFATVDPGKFAQILQNLIRNAIEAVTTGGRVSVVVRADAANLYVEVADDGPGIPDEVRHRIYEPFFSTKEGGTGLGMSIVHSMVALHGGVIGIDSGPHGTRCEVVMPRSIGPAERG